MNVTRSILFHSHLPNLLFLVRLRSELIFNQLFNKLFHRSTIVNVFDSDVCSTPFGLKYKEISKCI